MPGRPSGSSASPATALPAAGLPVARVPPHRGRVFAVSAGHAAKSDPRAARVLARFGTVLQPRLTPAPAPEVARWQALSTRRAQVQERHAAAQHRAAQVTDPEVRASCDAVLDLRRGPGPARRSAGDDRGPARRVHRGPARVAAAASAPVLDRTTAHLLLAELPELGHLGHKQLAALVGVAPVVQQRGTRRHEAPIAGGRTRVRTGLWLPTMTAMRHTPVIRPIAGRLRTAGKAHQVIVIACMHKLLTLLNAMVARGEAWAPRDAPA